MLSYGTELIHLLKDIPGEIRKILKQTREGKIYNGANYEDVGFKAIHAEVAAIINAFNDGVKPENIVRIATYSKDMGLPGSYCRQRMLGYGLPNNLEIFGMGENRKIVKTTLEKKLGWER